MNILGFGIIILLYLTINGPLDDITTRHMQIHDESCDHSRRDSDRKRPIAQMNLGMPQDAAVQTDVERRNAYRSSAERLRT